MAFTPSAPCLLVACLSLLTPTLANPLDLSTLKLSPIALSNTALKFPYGKFEIQDPVLTNNIKIQIPLLNSSVVNLARQFRDVSKDIVVENMPTVLTQYGFTSAQIPVLVQRGAADINEWAISLLEDEGPSNKRRDLEERGIGDIFRDLGCGAVAAAATPVYLLAAANFRAQNSNWEPISTQQMFFAHAVHGGLAMNAPVHFYFRATRSAGFTAREVHGTTFNRDVYTYLANAPTADLPMFNYITTLLIHELAHVDQYRQMGYSLGMYAFKYLFEACKVGGRHDQIPMEVSAKATETYADKLLVDATGRWFFEIWRANTWVQNRLGYPIARAFADTASPQVKFLRFQFGAMEISYGASTCFRTFTTEEMMLRVKTCETKPEVCKRAPMPPTEIGENKPPVPPPREPKPQCDLAAIREQNKQCLNLRATIAAINNRGFDCNNNVRVMKNLPNCPPKCQVVSLPKPESKPCRESNAPDTCFNQEEVRKQNAACEREKARCGM